MIIRLVKRKTGIALVIVLIIIASLVVIATGFAFSMGVEARLVRNTRYNPDLDWLGRSGVELARYILSKRVPGEERMDALHQRWAGGPGRFAGPMSDGSIAELEPWEELSLTNVKLGQGTFSIKITDQERKLNINSAPEPLLRYILEQHAEVAATDVDIYIDSLKDWMDPDENPGLNGAESDDYLGEPEPYYAKNGPLDHITELKMVMGFKDDPVAYEIFAKHFTAISGGLVNINTTTAEVLELLPGMDPIIAQDIIGFRSEQPYQSVGDINQIAPPEFTDGIREYLSTQSATFEVEVTAQVGNDPPRKYRSLLRRVSLQDIRILYFHSE